MADIDSSRSRSRSSEESSPNEDINSKLDSILTSINKMAPIVKNMEDNLPGFMKMKEAFDRETLGLENSENEIEDTDLISKVISDDEEEENNDKISNEISDSEDLVDKNLTKSSRPNFQSINPLFRTLSFGKENTTVIDEDTSVCISKVLKEGMDKEELKNILDNTIVPKNCPRLTVVPTNSNIEDLSPQAKHVDRQLIKIQKVLTSGLSILSQCISEVIQKDKCDLKLMSEATALFAHSSHMLDKQRRNTYQSSINFDYAKSIIAEDYPIEDKLFGEDMNDKIKNVAESIKHTQKIKPKRFFFKNHPYSNNKPFLGNRFKNNSQFKKNYNQFNNNAGNYKNRFRKTYQYQHQKKKY